MFYLEKISFTGMKLQFVQFKVGLVVPGSLRKLKPQQKTKPKKKKERSKSRRRRRGREREEGKKKGREREKGEEGNPGL